MKHNVIHKTACLLATALFLLIAWATSIEEYYRSNLPLSVLQNDTGIFLTNEGSNDLDSLTLVLNGLYSLEMAEIPATTTKRFLHDAFSDLNGTTFPQTEKPHKLEVYYNGNNQGYRGGYFEYRFEE